MKTKFRIILLLLVFLAVSCDKSVNDPIEDDPPGEEIPDDPTPDIYDDVELNKIKIVMGDYEWSIDTIIVIYRNSKLYFNIFKKKNSELSLHFVLVNFDVDSFPVVKESPNIANFRYPVFNDEGALDFNMVTSFSGDFPGGYFVIDRIDTTEQIVYGYFEFMIVDNNDPYHDVFKIKKTYFKMSYQVAPNSLDTQSAEIYMNSEELKVIDIKLGGSSVILHSYIVFDDNSAAHLYFYHEKLTMGLNPVDHYGGFKASWYKNIDIPMYYYIGSGFTFQADSGFVNIIHYNIDSKTIHGELDLYYRGDNLTGNFEINF
jgi:hypothetical protein